MGAVWTQPLPLAVQSPALSHLLVLSTLGPPASLPSKGAGSRAEPLVTALRHPGGHRFHFTWPRSAAPSPGACPLPSEPGALGEPPWAHWVSTEHSGVFRCRLPHDTGEGASLQPRGHLPARPAPRPQCHPGEQRRGRAVIHSSQGEHAQVHTCARACMDMCVSHSTHRYIHVPQNTHRYVCVLEHTWVHVCPKAHVGTYMSQSVHGYIHVPEHAQASVCPRAHKWTYVSQSMHRHTS